jgi:glycosyltransferase involved in cell wall biosynthesis
VLLTGDAVGGVWRYNMDLAQGLMARGIGVALAVLGPPPSQAQLEEVRQTRLELIPTSLPLDWTVPSAEALRAVGAELAGLAGRLRVDRVHLHTPALAAEVPWAVPFVAVAHSDVGTWWHAVHGTTRLPTDLAWRAEAAGQGLAEADAVIAPTRAFAQALEVLYRPERTIDVVHNGSLAAPLPEQPRLPGVLTAGRLWDRGKNVALLDRLAPLMAVPIKAAGPLVGPNGAAIAFEHLECLGTLGPAALAQEMARTGIYASASLYEPFGLAVLEAARAGMALALSDIPSHRELWHGAALFFHPEDDGAARDVLRRLLEARDVIAARAKERSRRYTADAMVETTLSIHRRLAARRAA